MSKTEEQRLVQQFIAQLAVDSKGRRGQSLSEDVLHRLARRDAMSLQADLSAAWQHRIACKLGAVVADDHARLAALGDQIC